MCRRLFRLSTLPRTGRVIVFAKPGQSGLDRTDFGSRAGPDRPVASAGLSPLAACSGRVGDGCSLGRDRWSFPGVGATALRSSAGEDLCEFASPWVVARACYRVRASSRHAGRLIADCRPGGEHRFRCRRAVRRSGGGPRTRIWVFPGRTRTFADQRRSVGPGCLR